MNKCKAGPRIPVLRWVRQEGKKSFKPTFKKLNPKKQNPFSKANKQTPKWLIRFFKLYVRMLMLNLGWKR